MKTHTGTSGLVSLGALFFAMFFFISPVAAASGLVRVSARVYAYLDIQEPAVANSFGANSGIIIGERGVAVIDTRISDREAQRFLADIRSVTDKPLLYAINTHHHADHTFGNAVFAGAGAEVIAHEECATAMRKNAPPRLIEMQADARTATELAGTTLSYPTRTLRDKMTLDLGGVRVELLYRGATHAPGSILVYVVEEKVVFTGDILVTDFHPYLGDSDLPGWHTCLDFLDSLAAEKVVPGHGPLSFRGDVVAMASYLTRFDVLARESVAQGKDLETVVAILKQSLPARTRGEWLIRANVQAKYLVQVPAVKNYKSEDDGVAAPSEDER